MSIVIPAEHVQADFERCVLQGWHQAHGVDAGRVSASWGEDRVVVMIEDVLFKGERLLTQSEQGRAVLEQYVQALLATVVEEQMRTLSGLLRQEIVSTSISVNTSERWVMIIFRLAE